MQVCLICLQLLLACLVWAWAHLYNGMPLSLDASMKTCPQAGYAIQLVQKGTDVNPYKALQFHLCKAGQIQTPQGTSSFRGGTALQVHASQHEHLHNDAGLHEHNHQQEGMGTLASFQGSLSRIQVTALSAPCIHHFFPCENSFYIEQLRWCCTPRSGTVLCWVSLKAATSKWMQL